MPTGRDSFDTPALKTPASFPGRLRMLQDVLRPSRNARALMFNPEQEINLALPLGVSQSVTRDALPSFAGACT